MSRHLSVKILPMLLWPLMAALLLMPPLAAQTADAGGAIASAQDTQDNPDIVFGGDALPVEVKERNANLPKVRSLFFSASDMAAIRKAVGVFTRIAGEGENPADFLKRMQSPEKPKQAQRYFVYPQFYLTSLVYDSEKDWSIRVNNRKLTVKEPEGDDGLRVTAIDKDKVTFEWLPSDMPRVEEVWRVAPNDDVRVDLRQGRVVFTLRTNQTFSSYVMRVLEGKVMPMVIDLSPKSKEDGKDDKPSVENKKPAPGSRPAASERDFLDSLLKAGGR